MPPTRGHDLKLVGRMPSELVVKMPPTRGHDLKRDSDDRFYRRKRMPPTRGHDLKRGQAGGRREPEDDAPHTGARLETGNPWIAEVIPGMPPTRGHDLKLESTYELQKQKQGCPPHGGTT